MLTKVELKVGQTTTLSHRRTSQDTEKHVQLLFEVLSVMSSWVHTFDMLLLLLKELINSIIIKFLHKQRSYHQHNFNLHTRYIKITAVRHLFCPLIYNVYILHTITSSLSWHRKTFTPDTDSLKLMPYPHSPISFVSPMSTACCTQSTPARACKSVMHKSRSADTVPTMSQDFLAN